MSLFDFLFPKKCVGCSKSGTYFCPTCIKTSEKIVNQVCPVCKKNSLDGVTHKRCRRAYLPDGLFVIWAYTGAPQKLITKLKYKFVYEVVLTVTSCLYGILANYKRSLPDAINWNDKDILLVPIPLSITRSNWRGFNQSEEIAKTLAKFTGWKVKTMLKRTKNTRPQVGLSKEDRISNMQEAFVLHPVPDNFKNMTIVLFDDVWTTGSTMLEATKTLKKAGFKKVWCLTLAR